MKKYKRFMTTKQRRSYDCGITCVLNILRFNGIRVKRSDFRSILKDKDIKRNGASMYDLIKLVEAYGLKAQGVKGDFEGLQKRGTEPAILMVQVRPGRWHCIVVYEINEKMVTIADPCPWVARISHMSKDVFAQKYEWCGEAILCQQKLKNL